MCQQTSHVPIVSMPTLWAPFAKAATRLLSRTGSMICSTIPTLSPSWWSVSGRPGVLATTKSAPTDSGEQSLIASKSSKPTPTVSRLAPWAISMRTRRMQSHGTGTGTFSRNSWIALISRTVSRAARILAIANRTRQFPALIARVAQTVRHRISPLLSAEYPYAPASMTGQAAERWGRLLLRVHTLLSRPLRAIGGWIPLAGDLASFTSNIAARQLAMTMPLRLRRPRICSLRFFVTERSGNSISRPRLLAIQLYFRLIFLKAATKIAEQLRLHRTPSPPPIAATLAGHTEARSPLKCAHDLYEPDMSKRGSLPNVQGQGRWSRLAAFANLRDPRQAGFRVSVRRSMERKALAAWNCLCQDARFAWSGTMRRMFAAQEKDRRVMGQLRGPH